MNCPNCHHTLSGNEKFCHVCGCRIPRCPTCNAVLATRMKYCKYDGTPIPPEVYGDPAQPSEAPPSGQTAADRAVQKKTDSKKPSNRKNTILMIAAIVLIVATLAVGIFLITRVLNGFDSAASKIRYEEASEGGASAKTLQEAWAKSDTEEPGETGESAEEADIAIPDEPAPDAPVIDAPAPEETAPETPLPEEPVAEPEDDTFVFPDSDSRYLSEAEVLSKTAAELRIARNEIYARHGRMFTSPDLDAHFRATSWYVPRYTAEEFDAFGSDILNPYEAANIDLILEAESRLG